MIRPATPADARAVAQLYNHYIVTTTITFQEEPMTEAAMAERIETVAAEFGWLVHEIDGELAGYCYATPWRPRSAYRFSVETAVYVAPAFQRRGVARALYEALIASLDAAGVRVILAGIALPNEPSVRFHEQLGFEKVAHLKQVGRKFERWIDVGYWERLLRPDTEGEQA